MSDKFQNKYRIPSARAVFHDYDGGAYFVTVCTAGMEHFFGEISNNEIKYTEIGWSAVREIQKTAQIWEDEIVIPIFAVMPNHIHLIVFIDAPHRRDASHASQNASRASQKNAPRASHENVKTDIDIKESTFVKKDACDASLRWNNGNRFGPQKRNLASVIRGIKSAVKSYANQNNIPFAWQPRYHDRIIRDSHEMNRIAEYIENNVIN